ncbi:hypothetical protein R3P38DRAFT_1966441 [Favolaschia claudopus]|uniref:I/LWEQ domain-containing protein n=1 Tax=Favolaschia claudopus TaxID=2862362 RepID=A0AAV9ZZ75_9AGAR
MPKNLNGITTRASDLCISCSMLPNAGQIQKIAHVCVEVCMAASNLNGNRQAEKLAAFIVAEAEKVLEKVVSQNLQPTPSPEIMQQLELFESKQYLPSTQTYGSAARDESLQTTEVKDLAHKLILHTEIFSKPDSISRTDYALEIVSLGARTLGAISEAPGLNLLKSATGPLTIICEQAKSVRRNREASAELARHASIVMKSIADCTAHSGVPSIESQADALKVLEAALGDIQNYLATLQKPRRRLTSWVMADQEKEKISQLDRTLDRALALFTSMSTLNTFAAVQAHDAEIRRFVWLQITVSGCVLFFKNTASFRDDLGVIMSLRLHFFAPEKMMDDLTCRMSTPANAFVEESWIYGFLDFTYLKHSSSFRPVLLLLRRPLVPFPSLFISCMLWI